MARVRASTRTVLPSLRISSVSKIADVLSEQFLPGPVEQAFRAAVDGGDEPVERKQGNGVVGVLKDIAIEGLTVWQWSWGLRTTAARLLRCSCLARRRVFAHVVCPSLSTQPAHLPAGRFLAPVLPREPSVLIARVSMP